MLLSCDPTDNEAGMKLLEDLTTNASQIQQQVLDQMHKPSISVAFSIANLIRNISRRKFPLSITKISSHTLSELPMESPHRAYPLNSSLSSSLAQELQQGSQK